MEAFKYTFSTPGAFTAAINYHRNAFRSTGRALRRSNDKVEKPILLIWVRTLDDHIYSTVDPGSLTVCILEMSVTKNYMLSLKIQKCCYC